VLWGLWHVPTFIAQGHTGTDLVPLVVSPIAASVLFTWVYNSTRGSLLLVWLFHTASTITGYLLGELPTVTTSWSGWQQRSWWSWSPGRPIFPGRGHDNASAPHRPHNPIHGPLPEVSRCVPRRAPGDPSRDAVRFS
jgi:hypothetical protein